MPSIREAAAFGFDVPINSTINQRMYGAVEEAHYKMTKYYSLEEWGNLFKQDLLWIKCSPNGYYDWKEKDVQPNIIKINAFKCVLNAFF